MALQDVHLISIFGNGTPREHSFDAGRYRPFLLMPVHSRILRERMAFALE